MAELRQNINMSAEKHGNKKPLVAAVSVICALVLLIIVFLAFKNPLYFSLAKSKAENGNYSAALELCSKTTDEKNKVLADYLSLRLEINEGYPQLLSDFDIAKINVWAEKATAVNSNISILGDSLAAEAAALSQTLNQISSIHSQYLYLRPDVLSLMDIFHEFNRLYTLDSSGKNTAFTVTEELSKISRWEQQNTNLSAYATSIPGYENIYLLNYLIKEVQGECTDLRSAMDSVIAMGYQVTDNIRLSGTAQKKFPGIQNSNNETVSVAEKEQYEKFMYEGICRRLAEILGNYYTP